MKKLTDKLLKYMIDKHNRTHVKTFNFSDLQESFPNAERSDIIEAVNYLSQHDYIKVSYYDNIPTIISLLPSTYCGNNADNGNSEPGATSESRKKNVSINWTAIGVIIAALALLFSILKEFF